MMRRRLDNSERAERPRNNLEFYLTILFISIVRAYQVVISPLLAKRCRYIPSCSSYMIEAIRIHGLRGIIMGVKRVFRCHPWGGFGFDPVAKSNSKK
jgi:uncharacterized protein